MFSKLQSLFGGGSKPKWPDAQTVAFRASAIKLTLLSGMVRLGEEEGGGEGEGLRAWQEAWRKSESCKHLTPWEKGIIQTDGVLDMQDRVDVSWRIEGFAVLCWALRLDPWIGDYAEQANPEKLLDLVPNDGLQEFASGLSLRPSEELSNARELAELWHWRLRTRQLIESGETLPDEMLNNPQLNFKTYDDIVRMTARELGKSGTLKEVIDEDFAIGGMAYRDVPGEEWGTICSITVERHRALNWLCGYAPGNRWEETPTGT